MSDVLSDGSIVPKCFMAHRPMIESQSEMCLRQGVVTKAYEPTDAGNISGLFVEYDVLVDHVTEMGVHSKVQYPRCKVASRFGGAADFEFFTYRKSTTKPSQLINLEKGSIVLVLCVNGDRRQGIIISGSSNYSLPQNPIFKKYALNSGDNYIWEFNGAIINVNDKGEFLFNFNGKTQDDGTADKSVDTDNNKTFILLDQYGQLELGTGTSNIITIGNNGGKTSNSNSNLIKVQSANGIQILSQDGEIKLQTNGSNPKGIKVGTATDAMVLGTTYRNAESQMNKSLISSLKSLQTQITTIGSTFTSLGATCSSVVVLSPLGGPLTNIGTFVTNIGVTVGQMSTAIQTFENSASNYLSKRNKLD